MIIYQLSLVVLAIIEHQAEAIEKLSTNGGDCKDYSVAKYYTLWELGVEEQRLRIMYVKDLGWN